MRDWRLGIVLAIGLGLAGLCTWRLAVNRPQDLTEQRAAARKDIPAPPFEGLDSQNQMFRLERYLGRHRVLIVFFSHEESAAKDAGLLAVRAAYDGLKRADVKVVGVSMALPQDNRRAMETAGDFPFELISDPDLSIHLRYARVDPRTQQPLTGVFLVDRKGTIASIGGMPQPVEQLAPLLVELTR